MSTEGALQGGFGPSSVVSTGGALEGQLEAAIARAGDERLLPQARGIRGKIMRHVAKESDGGKPGEVVRHLSSGNTGDLIQLETLTC